MVDVAARRLSSSSPDGDDDDVGATALAAQLAPALVYAIGSALHRLVAPDTPSARLRPKGRCTLTGPPQRTSITGRRRVTHACTVDLEWWLASSLDAASPPLVFPHFGESVLPPRDAEPTRQLERARAAAVRLAALVPPSGSMALQTQLEEHAAAALVASDATQGDDVWRRVHELALTSLSTASGSGGDARVYIGVQYNSGEGELGEALMPLGGYGALQGVGERLHSTALLRVTPRTVVGALERPAGGEMLTRSLLSATLVEAIVSVEPLASFTQWHNEPPSIPPSPTVPPPSPGTPPVPIASPPPFAPPLDVSAWRRFVTITGLTLVVSLVAIATLCCGTAKQRARNGTRLLSAVRTATRVAIGCMSRFRRFDDVTVRSHKPRAKERRAETAPSTELEPLSPSDPHQHAWAPNTPPTNSTSLPPPADAAAAHASSSSTQQPVEARVASPVAITSTRAATAHAAATPRPVGPSLTDPCAAPHAPPTSTVATTASAPSPPLTCSARGLAPTTSPPPPVPPACSMKAYVPRISVIVGMAPVTAPAAEGKLVGMARSERAPLSSPSSGHPTRRLSATAQQPSARLSKPPRQKRSGGARAGTRGGDGARRAGSKAASPERDGSSRCAPPQPPPTLPPTLPLKAESLAAREAAETAARLAARAQALAVAPTTALDFEVLAYADAWPCSLYEYNDILLRRDPPRGQPLDADVINAGRTYLQVDGYPALGAEMVDAVPRVFVYGQSDFYTMLHLGETLAPTADGRPDVNTSSLYRVAPGEAKRRVSLVRRRWPHEEEPGAARGGHAADAEATSARARCGSHEADGDGDVSTSSLPPPISQRSGSSRRARPARMPREKRDQTLNALRCAAAVREDAGKVWPGGVPLAESEKLGMQHLGAAPAVDDETLHALLGFPDDALEA